MSKLERLNASLQAVLGSRIAKLEEDLGELTLDVAAADYIDVARCLRDDPALAFAQMVDLCGIDYEGYGGAQTHPARFAVVLHLLSLQHNWRLRLRVHAADESLPVLASICDVWPAANWYEREAFDMYGILFEGHPDLRRILTDYGFVGHPFRKDFPVSGFMEMIYDEAQGRVVYQPVSIEPRENTPRIVREENYGGARG